MIFCLDSEFKPLTLKETSLNSFQSDFTCVRSRLTRVFLCWGVFFYAFSALSSTPTVILVFWLDFLLLRRQLVFSCSFSFGASLITGRVAEIACFGRHCCSFGESRCPFLLLVFCLLSWSHSFVCPPSMSRQFVWLLSHSGCWTRSDECFFLFLCCSVFHVSVFAVDVLLLHLNWGFRLAWGHKPFSWWHPVISCHISECIPLLLLLFAALLDSEYLLGSCPVFLSAALTREA
jgi:hypothetical protein